MPGPTPNSGCRIVKIRLCRSSCFRLAVDELALSRMVGSISLSSASSAATVLYRATSLTGMVAVTMPRKTMHAMMIFNLPTTCARRNTTRSITVKPIMAPREPVRNVVNKISTMIPPATALPGSDLDITILAPHRGSPRSSACAISLGLPNLPCVRKSRPLSEIPKTLEISVKTNSA